MAVNFDASHSQAFRALGALTPGQHWSAFDVPRDLARKGQAALFVTTLWNFHSTRDHMGRRVPTEIAIVKDRTSGTLWYRIDRPSPGTTRKTWVAHWDGLQLALASKVPTIGVLKDVHSGRCSLEQLFDCGEAREQIDGRALWLHLIPRGALGCDVREVDISQIVLQSDSVSPIAAVNRQFEAAIHESLLQSAAQRRARLESAPRLPRRIEAITTIFVRNPDVVVETLSRADGVCEQCTKPAPFTRRSDGTPYLEVHHRIPLAVGGEDTLENAVALCPNCHRAAHYA